MKKELNVMGLKDRSEMVSMPVFMRHRAWERSEISWFNGWAKVTIDGEVLEIMNCVDKGIVTTQYMAHYLMSAFKSIARVKGSITVQAGMIGGVYKYSLREVKNG